MYPTTYFIRGISRLKLFCRKVIDEFELKGGYNRILMSLILNSLLDSNLFMDINTYN